MERYVRVKKIGEGSFGKAFLVKKKNDGKHYVIKEISISQMKAKEREESRKEVKVLSQLKHPNIVSYKESFEETGNLYIVMDYCDGGDLYKKINGQRGTLFSEDQVMDWFVQIALGIKHVHDRKILHRDIKSQNIFLTRHGIVKLGDFGIARVLHSTVELARTCIGTPYYLSPEIVENRPYNNKSDIWSLGCVLYEMLTLKHAFATGNMKNLVLKIIRGSYPPIPLRYSADVRLLVAQLLKRNPHDRPSVNTVLKRNYIQTRIQKFLSQEVIDDEFSHTVLHRKPFGVQGQRPLPPRPAPAKHVPAAPKFSEPKAKYAVSVARKKPPKKPSSGGEPAKKPVKVANAAKFADKRKEIDARERRRRELMNQQDQMYNEYMKKVQQQRWEKQQHDHINRAREQAWKSTMSVGLSPEKAPGAGGNQQAVLNKDHQPMNKYKRPFSAQQQKENIPEVPKPARPSSAVSSVPSHPNPALEAVRQGEINRAYGADAAERARVKEEFWNRKRAAQLNKMHGQADYGGYEYRPTVQPKVSNGKAGRNKEDQDYLARLEAIRRQNYAERREIQKRMAGIRGPVEVVPSKKDNVSGDPRYDAEARKKKIAALKVQADERAAMLRKQLDEKKKAVLEKLNRAGKEKWEKEQKRMKEEKLPSGNERALPRRAVHEDKPAVAAVGLETALKQVGVRTLFRSNSENDIPKISKDELSDHAARKQWGNIPFQPRLLPLEVTASHMEATSVNDAVVKPADESNQVVRRQWGQQKTQIVSALGNIKLQTATSMPCGSDESDAAVVKKSQATESSASITGQTITISKQVTAPPSSPIIIGQTVSGGDYPVVTPGHTMTTDSPTVSQGITDSPSTPQTVIVKNDVPEEQGEQTEPPSPMEAWSVKATTPEGSYADEEKPEIDARDAYQQFLKSVRHDELDQVEPKGEVVNSANTNDLQVEDLSIEESSFHTADGSPENASHTELLITGNYDTSSKHLRTCSMPDLRLIFATPVKDPEEKDDADDNDIDDEINQNGDDDDNEGDDGDDEFIDDDDEEELDGSTNEDEEDEEDDNEYENMLASMRDVLISSARSPSPMKSVGIVQSMEWDPSADTDSPTADDNDSLKEDNGGRSSELSNLNEDWDSGEGDDVEDAAIDDNKHQDNDDDSVFQRLEESRLALEQELGFDRFLKVYRYLQTIQENEDEDANVGSSSDEISELLGDKEHLYPKILYLVIADSAYSEDNQ